MVTRATTFRQTVVSAIKDTLDTYVIDHPDTLEAVYLTRPESFGNVPCAYIGKRVERIRTDLAVRNREMTTSIVLVDRITDNVETMGRLDALVDGVLDALTDAMRSVIDGTADYGPLSITGVDGDELDIGGVFYEIAVISLMAETQEGTGL